MDDGLVVQSGKPKDEDCSKRNNWPAANTPLAMITRQPPPIPSPPSEIFFEACSRFGFRALATDGSITTGEIDANSRKEALEILAGNGLQPIEIYQTASAATTTKPPSNEQPIETYGVKPGYSKGGEGRLSRIASP